MTLAVLKHADATSDPVMPWLRLLHLNRAGITIFGETIWLGWVILPELFFSTVLDLLLGRAKATSGTNTP
jgi:hypothetical protein